MRVKPMTKDEMILMTVFYIIIFMGWTIVISVLNKKDKL